VGTSSDAIRATVDEVAIRGLIAAYADVVNRRAWDEFPRLFAPDARIELDLRDRPVLAFDGPDAIAVFIAAALEQYPFFEFVALNVRVMADGSDRAEVRTYMCELRQDRDGRPSRAFGLYQDAVTRVGPRAWCFARRDYQSMGRGEYGLDLMPLPVVGVPPEPRTG
jgi:SnoaL-like domain